MTADPASAATVLEVRDGVGTITLNRPESRNALSAELVSSLADRLDAAIDDPAVHVVVLTGSGTAFCAGADLKERRTVTVGAETEDDVPTFVRIFQRIQTAPKVVVGRIQGHALAGGLGLAASCDISVASTKASFGFTEVRLGLAPAIISVVCIPKLRTADVTELFLTGERIDADTAARVGLVNHAVAPEALDEAVAAVVDKVLLCGPGALAATKQLLARVPQFAAQDDAYRWTAALSASMFGKDEGLEGMKAFAEKRTPSWARVR